MKLGKYDTLQEIGKGSFGVVYKARDTALDIDVALKLLKPVWMDDPKAVDMFYREARAAARLEHPHIVHIRDVGEAEGRLFIAMQFVDGQPLNEAIKQNGAMPLVQVLPIAQQIADALDYAHAQGLVHRDIKPGNILIRKDGRALLTDFGLARGVEQASLMSSASVGSAVGTPEYVAPELWKGGAASGASDAYAFACVVYEMLAGKALFSGSSGPEVMFKHFEPPRLDDLPDPRLRDALAAALVADAGARPSERDLVARLQAVADGPAAAPKPILADGTASAPTPAPVTTKPAPAVAPAAQPKPKTRWGWVLVPVLLVGGVVAWLAGQNPRPPAPAATPTVATISTNTATPKYTDQPPKTEPPASAQISPTSAEKSIKISVNPINFSSGIAINIAQELNGRISGSQPITGKIYYDIRFLSLNNQYRFVRGDMALELIKKGYLDHLKDQGITFYGFYIKDKLANFWKDGTKAACVGLDKLVEKDGKQQFLVDTDTPGFDIVNLLLASNALYGNIRQNETLFEGQKAIRYWIDGVATKEALLKLGTLYETNFNNLKIIRGEMYVRSSDNTLIYLYIETDGPLSGTTFTGLSGYEVRIDYDQNKLRNIPLPETCIPNTVSLVVEPASNAKATFTPPKTSLSAPQLLSPIAGAHFGGTDAPVFTWSWSGTLATDETFVFAARHEKGEDDTPTKNFSATARAYLGSTGTRINSWAVCVVKTAKAQTPNACSNASALVVSEWRPVTWEILSTSSSNPQPSCPVDPITGLPKC